MALLQHLTHLLLPKYGFFHLPLLQVLQDNLLLPWLMALVRTLTMCPHQDESVPQVPQMDLCTYQMHDDMSPYIFQPTFSISCAFSGLATLTR